MTVEDGLSADEKDAIIFEVGRDPGQGFLRVVGNLAKVVEVGDKRDISLKEMYEVVFGKGRSTLIEEYLEEKQYNGQKIIERQFRIAGLTNNNRPLLIVLTPRDEAGLAKRIITAWQLGSDSPELKKLYLDCPHLLEECK
jgi:hypothetical protein